MASDVRFCFCSRVAKRIKRSAGCGKVAQKSDEYRGSLRAIAGLDQAVELNPVIFRGQRGLVQPRVDIRQRLQSFLMRRRLFEHRLVLAHGFAELVLLQAFARPIEMFVDVLCHGRQRVPRALRACWGSPPASFAATSSRVPIFSRGSNFHYIPDAKPLPKRIHPSVLSWATNARQSGNQERTADRFTCRSVPARKLPRALGTAATQPYARAPARAWLGNSFTFSRMDFNDNPLRTNPANPRNIKGTVSARNAKNEKPVAVVFST